MSDDALRAQLATLEAEVTAQRFAIHALFEAFRSMPDDRAHERILYEARTNLAIALEGSPTLAAARGALDRISLPDIPSHEHQRSPA